MTAHSPTWMVTGANGFLGANAVNYLNSKASVVPITRAQHDLTQPETLAREIETTRPTYLLHIAAIADHGLCERQPELAMKVNGTATKILAQACQQAGTKLIYISTDAVFSGQPTPERVAGNYSESDNPSPTTVYGESKLAGERFSQIETEPLIIRTNFFGWSPTGDSSILEFFVNQLTARNQVNGFINVTTTSLYVPSLLDYIYQLKDNSGVFHGTSRDAITKYQFGIEVANEFDLDPSLIVPTESNDGKDISLDTTKLSEFIQCTVASQHEGITFCKLDASRP